MRSPLPEGAGDFATSAPAIVRVFRGEVVESAHRVHVAAVDSEGRLQAFAGDPRRVTFTRSCAKPFQALPLLSTGALERSGSSDRELAIACGSHGGEPAHVETVRAWLARLDLDEAALGCGRHAPLTRSAARVVGADYGSLHHNCSGKHAGMLAVARTLGEPPESYLDPSSATQACVVEAVAREAGVPKDAIRTATDGCSAPNFALPLATIGRLFARLGAARQGDLARVRGAMLAHPEMIAGTDAFDTDLARAFGGAVVSKVGAEGVLGIATPRVGIALKVDDGATRARPPVALAVLEALGFAPADPKPLERHADSALRNYAGNVVGRLDVELAMRRV